MAYIYNLIDTWNNAGTTFTAIKMNVTDTNSSASSLLMDLQVGATSKFSVDKNGNTTVGSQINIAASSYNLIKNIQNGLNAITIVVANVAELAAVQGGAYARSLYLGTSTTSTFGNLDTILTRDAAATLAQRNSTNAQTYRLYGTYTDASNYERGYLTTDSNGFTIGTEALGTGTKRPVRIIGPSLASAEAVSILELSQTWNTSGTPTGLKLNVTDTASNASSLLMDLQVGGVSRGQVGKDGKFLAPDNGGQGGFYFINTATGISINGANLILNSASGICLQAIDTILTRRGVANLRLGAADVGAGATTVTITIAAPGVVTWGDHRLSSGTPVVFTTTGALPTGITAGTTYYVVPVNTSTFQLATSVANAIAATPTVITTSGTQSGTHTGTRYNISQRLSMQGVTGVTDRLGADLFIQGSQGTGTGAGGSLIFQVAPAGSTGTAQNALATALTIDSARKATFAAQVNAPSFETSCYIWATSNTGAYYWGVSFDVALFRDAANTLALRNSTAAQAFNIYNTFTDVSNYERGFMRWNSNVLQIGTEKLGTGVNRSIRIVTSGGSYIDIGDTTLEISGSTGWADANALFWSSRTMLRSPSNGVLTISNRNETDFGRLQFGGTTSSFPALKRSSTTLQARLADDSGFASVQGKITTETAYTAGAPTPTGYIVLYDSNGTAYKVPAQLL